jgi:TRAP-type mannitol/chloroaromatic compound transport system permease small subunit
LPARAALGYIAAAGPRSSRRRDECGRIVDHEPTPPIPRDDTTDGAMRNVLRRCDRGIAAIIAAAKWLVLPVALLLLLQWPLREVVQRFSREANDLGQLFFATYVAVALTCASRHGAHLATDVVSHRYSARVRQALIRAALAFALVPWSLFVLVTSATTTWRSVVALESFPETYNPGYFVIRIAVWLLAALALLQALVAIAAPPPRDDAR